MSNSRYETHELKRRNISFQQEDAINFQSSFVDCSMREPLRQAQIMNNIASQSPEIKHSLYRSPVLMNRSPASPALYTLRQDDHAEEIRKLEEVIYYLTCDKDVLKQSCVALQIENDTLRVSYSKERDGLDAQIRKLKEMIKDKQSQCESISKNALKQKEIFQQEIERLKAHTKSLIEKKNDEVYSLTRQKYMEKQQAVEGLQAALQQTKNINRKQIKERQAKIQSLEEELAIQKQGFKRLVQQIQLTNEQNNSQKTKIIQSYQIILNDIRQKNHQNRSKMLNAASEQIQILEKNSQIQRSAFFTEINCLKAQIDKYKRENQHLHEVILDKSIDHEQNQQKLLQIIKQLQQKIQEVHRAKQQQIQHMKVKISSLHNTDLRSLEEVYSLRITALLHKLETIENQSKLAAYALQEERNRYKRLLAELKERDSQAHEQIASLKYTHKKILEQLKHQSEQEKQKISEHFNHIIQGLNKKLEKSLTLDDDLRKLKQSYEKKVHQLEQIKQISTNLKNELNQQKKKTIQEKLQIQNEAKQEIQKGKREAASKHKEIDRLTQKIAELSNLKQDHDFTDFEKEIRELTQRYQAKAEQAETWKQRADSYRLKVQIKENEQSVIKQKAEKSTLDSQNYWQEKGKEKNQQIQAFYKRKIDLLELDKDQLREQNKNQRSKIQQLVKKYQQLQRSFFQLIQTMKKRSQMQQKIVMLGLDQNLIKNKQQLFQY